MAPPLAIDTLVIVLSIVGTVLGGLVSGGAVVAWLAPSNRKKIEAETASATEQATTNAVQTVTLALDRQDKTIARQDAERERQDADMTQARGEIAELAARVGSLEASLTAAAVAEHLASGRILILRAEVGRLGGDVDVGLRGMGVAITEANITDATVAGVEPAP